MKLFVVSEVTFKSHVSHRQCYPLSDLQAFRAQSCGGSIQEKGCDLRRCLPLSHHLRVVQRLVTARSSSLRRVPGTLCHLRHSAPSSVCHVSPLIFPNCAHRILFCILTLKSVLEVIFRLLNDTLIIFV